MPGASTLPPPNHHSLQEIIILPGIGLEWDYIDILGQKEQILKFESVPCRGTHWSLSPTTVCLSLSFFARLCPLAASACTVEQDITCLAAKACCYLYTVKPAGIAVLRPSPASSCRGKSIGKHTHACKCLFCVGASCFCTRVIKLKVSVSPACIVTECTQWHAPETSMLLQAI